MLIAVQKTKPTDQHMKLYYKKLEDKGALDREKKRLEKELAKMEEDDLFSIKSLIPTNKKMPGKEDSGLFSQLLDYIPAISGNPLLATVVSTVQKRFLQPSEKKTEKPRKPQPAEKAPSEGKKEGRNIIKSVAIEIVTGYLKWKAIQLSFKGARYLINQRKKRSQKKENQP